MEFQEVIALMLDEDIEITLSIGLDILMMHVSCEQEYWQQSVHIEDAFVTPVGEVLKIREF